MGWGMRIEFVPDDQLHPRPALEVREPAPEDGIYRFLAAPVEGKGRTALAEDPPPFCC
jgi:hypothetical protein